MGHTCSRTSTASDSDDECEAAHRSPDIVIVGANLGSHSRATEASARTAKLVARIRRKLPCPSAVFDDGNKSPRDVADAVQAARLGILVLTEESVRRRDYLLLLADLLAAPACTSPPLLAVLCGLDVEQLQHMRHLYNSLPWHMPSSKPSTAELDAWAETVRRVATHCTLITAPAFLVRPHLASDVAACAVELLEAARKVPAASRVVHNKVGAPRVRRAGARPNLKWADAPCPQGMYVEVRGGPGEGKTVLVQHLVARTCEAWARQDVPQELARRRGGVPPSHALPVDLQGLTQERGFKDTVADAMLAQVEQAAYKDHWEVLQQWLQQRAGAQQLVLFEHAEDSVHLKAFREVVLTLLDLHVVVIVATRKPSSLPESLMALAAAPGATPPSSTAPHVSCQVVGICRGAKAASGHHSPTAQVACQVVSVCSDTKATADQQVACKAGKGGAAVAKASRMPPRACHVVDLQAEARAGGLALLEALLGQPLGKAQKKQGGPARLLVEAVRGNALLLAVAAGLVKLGKCTFEALLDGASKSLPPPSGTLATHPAACTRQQIALLHAWLAAHLPPPEQRLLASLSPFAGSFTAAAAAAVNTAADPHDIHLHLLALSQASLLSCRLRTTAASDAAHSRVLRYALHPTVRRAAARLLPTESAAVDATAAFTAWTLEHPDGPGRLLSRSDPEGQSPDLAMVEYLMEEELPNVTAAAAHLGPVLHATALDTALPDMVAYLGRLLREMGCWRLGRLLQEELLAARQVIFGGKHLDTLLSKEDLSWTLCQVGLVEQMRRLQEEILEVRTGVLGTENRETLNSLASFGLCLHLRGQLDDARRILEQATAATTAVLGPDHLSTLFAKSCLAITLEQLGLLRDAKLLHEEVLAAKVRVLGPEHPDTLNSRCDVAWTLNLHGQLHEARKLQEEVLGVRAKVLGPRHPNVLIASRANLAAFLFLLGELQQAKAMQVEVLAVATRLLGREHPHTIISTNNLAETLFELGDWTEARRLQEGLVELCEAVLAGEHSETLTSKCNLAITLREMGELARARALCEEVLAVATRLQASDSLRILNCRSDLAVTLSRMGELEEAKRLLEGVLRSRVQLMGPEHPDTLATQHDLAVVMGESGQAAAAAKVLRGVVDKRGVLLGARHPRTLAAKHDLGALLGRLGYEVEARRLLEEGLLGREAVLGAAHPHTAASRERLAALSRA